MNIAVMGSRKSGETKQLINASKKMGHEAVSILIEELIFEAGRVNLVLYKGKDMAEQFDAVIFRGINKHPDENLILAQYLKGKGARVIDDRLSGKRYLRTKLSTAYKFSKAGILYPKTYFVTGRESRNSILENVKYPIIVKKIWGMHSQSIFRFKNKEEAESFFEGKIGKHIIQEDLKEKDYFRVFVIKDKAIGALHRVKTRALTYKKVAAGVKSKAVQPDKGLANFAIKATKISGNEICGLDIIKHKGKYWVIEANRSPQFEVLSEITGINVAEKIIEYIQKTV